MMRKTDLQDAATPEDVAPILRNAAEQYRESTLELQAAWQDRNAGKVWDKIARELEHSANRITLIVAKGY